MPDDKAADNGDTERVEMLPVNPPRMAPADQLELAGVNEPSSRIAASQLSLTSEEASTKFAMLSSLLDAKRVPPEQLTRVSEKTAQKLKSKLLIAVRPDQAMLGVAGGGHGLATTTKVTLAVHRPIDVREAEVLSTESALTNRVAASLLELSDSGTSTAQTVMSEQPNPRLVQLVADALENQPQGLTFAGAGFETLLDYGIIPLPALTGTHVEVGIEPGSGYLGEFGATPLTLETDAAGVATFWLRAGSHPGKIRLRVTVVETPDHSQLLPESTIELVVYPADSGPDPATLVHPRVEPPVQQVILKLPDAGLLDQTPNP